MGASRHCGNGVHRIGSGDRATRSDGCSGRYFRGIRSRTRALTKFAPSRLAVCLGLGLIVAGAVLHSPAGAQVRDSVRRDTVRRRDTTITVPVPPRADSVLRDSLAKKGPPPERRDSIKAPIAHSETPTDISIARKVSWSRDSLFA